MRSLPTPHRTLGRTLAAMCCVWLLPQAAGALESPQRPASASASAHAPVQPAPRSEKIGDATLLAAPDALTSAVAVTALVRAPQVTSATPQPAAGLRHLLERLLMDPSHPAGARAMQLRAQGWRVQAFTTPEYTAYQVVGDRQRVADALLFVRDVLCEPPLPPGRDGDLRLAQHRQALSLPAGPEPSTAAPLHRLFDSAFGDRHPGARAIVGSPEQLAGLSVAALREHWQQAYRPAALTLVVSGGFESAALSLARSGLTEIDAQVARTRGRVSGAAAWPAPRAAGQTKTPASEAHRPGPQLVWLPASADRLGGDVPPAWLGFALDGATPIELAALDVATQLGLPQGFSASLVPGPRQSPSLWVLRVPAAAADPAETVRAAVHTAARLADGITDEVLAQARRRLIVEVAQRAETVAGQGLRLGSLWLSGQDEAGWQQRVLTLSAADLRHALRRFLQADRLSLLLPSSSRMSADLRSASERRIREQLQVLSARTMPVAALRAGPGAMQSTDAVPKATVLRAQSGAHVVLLPEAAPSARVAGRTVAITALWPGGRHREESRQRGLHDLLVRVWPRATTALPAFRFATLSSELQLRLGAEATDDALALRAQLPSENLPQALALLRDCIESPALIEADVERARRDVVLASRRPPLRALAPRGLRSGSEIDAARFAWQLFQGSLSPIDTGSAGAQPKSSAVSRSVAYEDLAATVAVLTTRQLHEQLRSYSHRQLVLSVVGDFDPHSVAAQLSPWLGLLQAVTDASRTQAVSAKIPAAAQSDVPAEPRRDTQSFAYAATQQAHLVLGARVPGCSAAPGAARSPAAASTQVALSLLLELLASESGIGQAQQALLSRRALAFTVEGIRTGCVPDSALALYVATSPRSLDAAEASLRDELRRCVDHPPDAAALALARERLASRWVLASQRRMDRSLQLARGWLFGQADPALGDDSPADLVRKLDPAALQAVAKQYLQEDRLLRAVVLPDSQRVAVGNNGVSLRPREPESERATPPASTRKAPAAKREAEKPHPPHAAQRTSGGSRTPNAKPGKPTRQLAGKPRQRL